MFPTSRIGAAMMQGAANIDMRRAAMFAASSSQEMNRITIGVNTWGLHAPPFGQEIEVEISENSTIRQLKDTLNEKMMNGEHDRYVTKLAAGYYFDKGDADNGGCHPESTVCKGILNPLQGVLFSQILRFDSNPGLIQTFLRV